MNEKRLMVRIQSCQLHKVEMNVAAEGGRILTCIFVNLNGGSVPFQFNNLAHKFMVTDSNLKNITQEQRTERIRTLF